MPDPLELSSSAEYVAHSDRRTARYERSSGSPSASARTSSASSASSAWSWLAGLGWFEIALEPVEAGNDQPDPPRRVRLDRYYQAFESGQPRQRPLPNTRVRPRDAPRGLREHDAALAEQLAVNADTAPDSGDLEAVDDQLEHTIAEEDRKQPKALLRLLVKELRVNGRSEILPTYRVITPEVSALPSPMGGIGSNQ